MLTAWSYSRWETYDTCPAQARFKFVEKVPEEENDAMLGGSQAHDEIAAYLRRDREPPFRGWDKFADMFAELQDLEPLVEQQWGFTSQWKPTTWFGRATWFRSVLDAAVIYDDGDADVVDFKTGKAREKHAQQAELYAASIFIRYPQTRRCTVRFWYLDHGTESVYRFERETHMSDIIERWTKRTKRMLSDTVMAPRPGQHCKWCSFAKSKGGPCKYG